MSCDCRSMLLLVKNPAFILLCLAGATEATLIAGMSTFGSKFLESQFGLSASKAATWFGELLLQPGRSDRADSSPSPGYMVVPAGGGGTFLGGYIIQKLKLRCRGIMRFCVTCTVMSLITSFVFIIRCPDLPMAGVTAPYRSGLTAAQQQAQYQQLYNHPSRLRSRNSSALEENLAADCNAGCACAREVYSPVCGADAMMYYSPCHAGCRSINHTAASAAKRVGVRDPPS